MYLAEEDDARLIGPNAPQILRSLPPKNGYRVPVIEPYIKEVLVDLLSALIVKVERPQEEGRLLYFCYVTYRGLNQNVFDAQCKPFNERAWLKFFDIGKVG